MKAKLLGAAVLVLIAGAIVITPSHPVSHHPLPRNPAAPQPQAPAARPKAAPGGETPPGQPARADTSNARPATATADIRLAASTFARTYALYLEGSIPVTLLVPTTIAVRWIAAQAGPIPRAVRGGWPTRLAVAGGESPKKTIALTDSDGHTYRAAITLTHTGAGWIVSELRPPRYAGLHPPPRPGGEAPPTAETAARVFFTTYVVWYYGQARASTISDASPSLRAALAAHPPRVPELQRTLHPRVGTLWLQWARSGDQWRGWGAWATINDGQVTYILGAKMRHADGRWLATSMIPTAG